MKKVLLGIITILSIVFLTSCVTNSTSNNNLVKKETALKAKGIIISFPTKKNIITKKAGQIGTHQTINIKNADGAIFTIKTTDGSKFRFNGNLVNQYSGKIYDNNHKLNPICGLNDATYKITVKKNKQKISKSYRVVNE